MHMERNVALWHQEVLCTMGRSSPAHEGAISEKGKPRSCKLKRTASMLQHPAWCHESPDAFSWHYDAGDPRAMATIIESLRFTCMSW